MGNCSLLEKLNKEINIPTANKMKERAEEYLSSNIINTLNNIKRDIISAVDRGNKSVYVQYTEILMSNKICVEYLESLGYKVELGSLNEETKHLTNTKISWE